MPDKNELKNNLQGLEVYLKTIKDSGHIYALISDVDILQREMEIIRNDAIKALEYLYKLREDLV